MNYAGEVVDVSGEAGGRVLDGDDAGYDFTCCLEAAFIWRFCLDDGRAGAQTKKSAAFRFRGETLFCS